MAGVSNGVVNEFTKAVEGMHKDVGVLVSRQDYLDRVANAALRVLSRGFWGRLKWLLLGR